MTDLNKNSFIAYPMMGGESLPPFYGIQKLTSMILWHTGLCPDCIGSFFQRIFNRRLPRSNFLNSSRNKPIHLRIMRAVNIGYRYFLYNVDVYRTNRFISKEWVWLAEDRVCISFFQ